MRMMHFSNMSLADSIDAVRAALEAEDEEVQAVRIFNDEDRYHGQTKNDLRFLCGWLEQARDCKAALVAVEECMRPVVQHVR